MLVTVNCSYVQILQQALISAHVKVRGWAGVAVVPRHRCGARPGK